jgi:hypothetical protein
MKLELWDPSTKVTFDQTLLNELVTLRFLESHAHVTIVGPVGVGKTFLAHALGHIACRRGASVLAIEVDKMLKNLLHARLDNSHEAELLKIIAVDLLILDDFCLDPMNATESRDVSDVLGERHRAGSVIGKRPVPPMSISGVLKRDPSAAGAYELARQGRVDDEAVGTGIEPVLARARCAQGSERVEEERALHAAVRVGAGREPSTLGAVGLAPREGA